VRYNYIQVLIAWVSSVFLQPMFDFEDYVYIFVHRVFVYLLTDLTDYHFASNTMPLLEASYVTSSMVSEPACHVNLESFDIYLQ
jgi:hypothetical protein